jgi:hypothetical protein
MHSFYSYVVIVSACFSPVYYTILQDCINRIVTLESMGM